jgi:hemoglobin-like flavoprotein
MLERPCLLMTPEQIKLIKWSFAEVYFARDESAKLFYDRLFRIAPDMRPLFKTDMESQGRKLMDTISLAVTVLGNPDRLAVLLEDTSKRHRHYGACSERYQAVGEALLWMLEKQLGRDFTAAVREAWTELYGDVSKAMQNLSRPARHPASHT